LLVGGRPGNNVLAPVATAAVAAALLAWLLLPGINGLVAAAFLDALRNASVWRALGVAAPLALFTAASRWPGLAGSVGLGLVLMACWAAAFCRANLAVSAAL
jgi:hypothetical protein